MNVWLRALSAEKLKLKRTLALWVVVLAPLVIAFLAVLVLWANAASLPSNYHVTPTEAWQLVGHQVLVLWCILMLPLYITLETALLAGLEHGNQQWKHLEALPVPRSTHYLAKWFVVMGMVACSYAILFALVPVVGWVEMAVAPSLGVAGPPMLGALVIPALASLAACLLVTALQTWIALRWQSFTVAVSIGIVATVMGVIVSRSEDVGKLFPWSLPMQAFIGHREHMIFAVWLGVIGGLVVAGLGLWDFLRRDSF